MFPASIFLKSSIIVQPPLLQATIPPISPHSDCRVSASYTYCRCSSHPETSPRTHEGNIDADFSKATPLSAQRSDLTVPWQAALTSQENLIDGSSQPGHFPHCALVRDWQPWSGMSQIRIGDVNFVINAASPIRMTSW
jgi:hypothetical protein